MDERRKYERFSVDLQGTVQANGEHPPQTCRVSELSQDGIRLLLNEKIQFGKTVTLSILVPGRQHPVAAYVVVRWNKQVYDNPVFSYLAGGELTITDSAEKKLLIEYALASGKSS